MPQDPEVNLKFNAESDKAQAQLQVLVDKFEHIAAAVTRAGERLQAFEADARELAENAERLDMLAYNTGKIEALREVNQVFSAGLATVSGYGEKVTECTNALIDFGGNAAKVLTEFQQGNLTMEQASAKLDRYSAAAAKNEKAVNSFAAAVKRGFDELAGAASLDDALSAWGAFEENVDQARQQITAAAEAIQQKKEALGELKEELDSTSESYAEQAQHLAKQEVALNKQAAELQKLRAELDKLSASARDAFSSKNMGENLSGSMSQLTSLSSKLEVTLAHTTQALSKLEVAETSCAAAAQKEAEQEQAAAYAMRLSAMSKTKLADETRKLIAARKQAAAVGDVAAYQKLTAQLGQCRTAMRALLQQQQMTKIAMLQQVQTAAMMGSQISSLAGQIRSGSTDIAGMASQVMSLGMALKAGLGPIGWVMMAIQGLQMAFDAWQSKKTDALNRQIESNRQYIERLEKAWKRAGDVGDETRKELLKSIQRERQELQEEAADSAQEKIDLTQRAAEADRVADEKRLLAAQKRFDIEKARVEVLKASGKINEVQAAEKIYALEDALRKEKDEIEREKSERDKEAAKEKKSLMEDELKDMEAQAKKHFGDPSMQKLLQIKVPTKAEIHDLRLKLDTLDEGHEKDLLRAVKDQNIANINEAKALMKKLGISIDGPNGSFEAVAEFVREMQELSKETEKEIKAKQREVKNAQSALEIQEERIALEDEQRKAAREIQAEQRAAADILLENKKIKKDLAEIEEKYKVKRDYAEQDVKTQSAIHAEDLKNLQIRRYEYESLKNNPALDADTLKEINKKIKDIDAQTHRVQKSMKQAALEAQKSIGALQPLGQKAKMPNLQGPLRQAEKSFTDLAKKAERQAANGDLKGLETTKKSMQRLALGMERMTGFTGKATKLYEQVTEDLKKVQQGETKGLTAKQQTENNIRKKLGAEERYHNEKTQAAKEAAQAAEAEAKAHELNAKNASQSVQANQPVAKTVQLSTDVNSLRSQVQQMETAQQTLNSNMGGLGGAVGKLAAAAENTAALAGKMATAAAAALGRLEKKISALEKQIDRLNRKI